MLRVTFQESEYVFVGDSLDGSGAIATLDDYNNGRCSFAHLCDDGMIRRFREVIGRREDNIGPHSLLGVICDPS